MVILDKELEKIEREGRSIRVGMIGAGFFGKGLALKLLTATKGIQLVAISNRSVPKGLKAYKEGGIDNAREVSSQGDLDSNIEKGIYCVTDNPKLLCQSPNIDVIVEATGTIQFSAEVILAAIRNGKHVAVNAELDATVGPILKAHADRQGVVYTGIDGDQPGVTMNLYRLLEGMGFKPVLCGNIKGLEDHYRTPDTQQKFANKWGQTPAMVTSFADGSKISFEQAVIANATGMKVGKRGMYGPTVKHGTHIERAIKEFPEELLNSGTGVVDYIVGASPGPGVFIIARYDHPEQQHYLNLYKMGEGPFYYLYRPFHLCHFEVPNSIGRAAIFGDATIAPVGSPSVEVVTVAKKDLSAGDILDGVGYFMTYGSCENTEVVNSENLLPIGAAEGCKLIKDVKKDAVLTYDDVTIPSGRLIDQLLEEQRKMHKKKIFINN